VSDTLLADSALIMGGTAFIIVSPLFGNELLYILLSVLALLKIDNSRTFMIS